MKNKLLFVLCIMLFGCSPRYLTFKKAANRLNKKEITRSQYDSIMDRFYTLRKDTITNYANINYQFNYVYFDTLDFPNKSVAYQTLKFKTNGEVIESFRINDSISNSILRKTNGFNYRYRVKNDELIIEYLQARDYKLYNIYKYARIEGNEIIFYKYRTLQIKEKSSKPDKKQKYILKETLKESPITPN